MTAAGGAPARKRSPFDRLPAWLRAVLAYVLGAIVLFIIGMALMGDGTIDPSRADRSSTSSPCKDLPPDASDLLVDQCADAADR